MIVITKRRFAKRYAVGGAGIFDTISGFVKRMLTSNAATEIGKKAIETVAINVGKRLVDKAAEKMFAPRPQGNTELSEKSKETLQNLIYSQPSANINNLLSGNGGAISIRDLVRGSGMKWA